jgi:hypothetical protein
MTKQEEYSRILQTLDDWIPYLMANSSLPGPRGNLELAYAAAHTSSLRQMNLLISVDTPGVLENTPEVFVVFCGIVSLGTHVIPGDIKYMNLLKQYANDTRWRIRESVAMALQEIGKKDMNFLLSEVNSWKDGSFLQMRAAAAGLCEPILLKDPVIAIQVLEILNHITTRFQDERPDTKEEDNILLKGLNYCWSVAVAEYPPLGKCLMEKWISTGNPRIQKIMFNNLMKNRLIKMDSDWVNSCRSLMNK